MELSLTKILDNVKDSMGVTYGLVGEDGENKDKLWLEFDMIDECSITGSATVTKYPTEQGIYNTDYKYRNPDTVEMTGVISSGGLTGLSSVLKRMGSWDRQTAIEEIRKNLRTLVANMTLLKIQTRNAGRREHMTLTSYTINETYDNYGSMEVSMQFQEVPRLSGSGQKVRNPADTSTSDTGITMTQVLAIGAGAVVAGSIIKGNIAALS